MKKKLILPAAILLSSSILGYSIVANADDDHHKEKEYYKYYNEQKYENSDYEKYGDKGHKKYEKHHDKEYGDYDDDNDNDYDDDDEYEKYEEYERDYYYNQQQPQISVTKEFWYQWSRSAAKPSETATLPITAATDISIKMNNEEPINVGAIPSGSELLVPVEEVAEYLGAKVTVYPNSEIIEINKDNLQLIVRNNTKVVYENMRKTPMQADVIKKNDKYYMPISVLANGLGVKINENMTNNQIQLKGVVQL